MNGGTEIQSKDHNHKCTVMALIMDNLEGWKNIQAENLVTYAEENKHINKSFNSV
jgi:hypothetical protein